MSRLELKLADLRVIEQALAEYRQAKMQEARKLPDYAHTEYRKALFTSIRDADQALAKIHGKIIAAICPETGSA